MKIGFDVSQTGKLKAGCGYFADGLIRSLAEIDSHNHYILYPTFGDLYWDPRWSSGVCRVHRPSFHRGTGHRTFAEAKLFWRHPPGDLERHLGDPDVIHSNNFFCPRPAKKARLVYTLYDLSFLVHPEWTTEANRIGCFNGVFEASIHADHIIAISQFTRNHFLRVFPHYPAERITVIYPASRYTRTYDLLRPRRLPPLVPQRYWLSVGVLEPRKNHLGLLRAYALLRKEREDNLPLVLAGGRGWLMDDIPKILADLGLRQDVIVLGYVDDGTLQWLYQNCFAFAYPSFFEGFGLPVLEAMTLGAPVIASQTTSIPEIVGEAGILIDPRSEESLARAMRALSDSESMRQSLKEKSTREAGRFSWKKSAEEVLECYREAIRRSRYFPDRVSPLPSIGTSSS
jgi:glycosyltransferase involved in cell wall biosynthesis